jgi:2,3-bisphosphoglycerate-independent phosphoglycerate mutase
MQDGFKKMALIILDGWGIGQKDQTDAIHSAPTPFFDQLIQDYPNATLTTFGNEVGLPQGQMGNSEVGHLNIGAGRIVYQELARINKEIKDKTLEQNAVLRKLIQQAKQEGKKVHLFGLLSDGGVHAHINHMQVLSQILSDAGLEDIFIHAFMDGRDTSPTGGADYIKQLKAVIDNNQARLATIIGRYYAMDRDNRWERIKKAYDLLVNSVGEPCAEDQIVERIKSKYEAGQTDEFIEPIVVVDDANQPLTAVEPGDIVLFINFRTDRPRELTIALTQEDLVDHGMHTLDLNYYTMTGYSESFKDIHVLFEKNEIKQTLGEVVSNAGKTQLRIAETEKYPHVTFFFNGGVETAFKGEDRILIPSPKVATYDLQPEMSAFEMTKALIDKVNADQPELIVLNYANTDMVGHTGVFEAAEAAAVAVDKCLSDLVPVLLRDDYGIIIIADHGNSDFMVNEDLSPNTAHTKNPVPIVFVSNNKDYQVQSGKLADIAPSILKLLQVDIPKDMTGDIIIKA